MAYQTKENRTKKPPADSLLSCPTQRDTAQNTNLEKRQGNQESPSNKLQYMDLKPKE
jgi:hypothetical protein